jgi:hypothetical protein
MKWWWVLALLALVGCGEEEAPPEAGCELAIEGEESCNHDEEVGWCCHGSTPGMSDICTAYKTVPGACSWMVDEAWENGTPLLDHPCRAVIGQCKNPWYAPEE